MVSDYFFVTAQERKKNRWTDEQTVEEVRRRISEVMKFIEDWFEMDSDPEEWKWTNPLTGQRVTLLKVLRKDGGWASCARLMNGVLDRMYIARAEFDRMVASWTQARRIKIDEQDWRYLILLRLRQDGPLLPLSWADSTLGIEADMPNVCETWFYVLD